MKIWNQVTQTGEDEDSNPGQPGCKAQDLSPVCIAFLTDKSADPSQHLPQSTWPVVASALCNVLYSLGSEFTHLFSSCPHHYIPGSVHPVAFVVNQGKTCRRMCPLPCHLGHIFQPDWNQHSRVSLFEGQSPHSKKDSFPGCTVQVLAARVRTLLYRETF